MKFSIPLKENHIAMWMWLSKHPEKRKWDWGGYATILKYFPDLLPYTEHFEAFCCFACQGSLGEEGEINCEDCPVSVWEETEVGWGGPCERGIFGIWKDSLNPAERSRLALKIAKGWR